MTIEPFKVQGMTFHLDSWEEVNPGIWEFFFEGEKLDSRDRNCKPQSQCANPGRHEIRSVGEVAEAH